MNTINIILSLIMVFALMALWFLGMDSIGYATFERDLQHCLNVVMMLYFFAALHCSEITARKITGSIRGLFK